MFSRKKIAAVSVLAGGLAVACTSITHAYAGQGSQACTRDILGNVTCQQRIQGQVSDGDTPHKETCTPVKPLTVPAALGGGTMRVGPEITCSAATTGAPDAADAEQPPFGLL
ncbi:hypothetical protein [Streptomyces sp. ISL-100]|uniref:hypothetical protein n=1 Tax=Streptomyces sp. ISL-100 TaxID=2819173 RepID=UPI001BEA8B3E|nr:hypothetical protein [Streptomyces sp. ISL-100]MBT2398249.1 hypothetical protein [Streptomyces sp. ISL-100]